MGARSNRYQNTRPFIAGANTSTVFAGDRARPIGPASGVLEYVVKAGDRLDLLALNFYVDSRMWWRILDANPDIVFAADLSLGDYVGETILIPRAVEGGAGQ